MTSLTTIYFQMKGPWPSPAEPWTAVALEGATSWVHLSRIKPASTGMLQESQDSLSALLWIPPFPWDPTGHGGPQTTWKLQVDFLSEPLQDLKLLFRKDK